MHVMGLCAHNVEMFISPSCKLCNFMCTLKVCVSAYCLQEMAHAWEEYSRLEKSVEQLRTALQAHMNQSTTTQVRHDTAAQSRFTFKAKA